MEDSEVLIGLLGIIMLYSVIHYVIISFSKTWSQRTGYEKVVTVLGIIIIALIFLETMFPS